jgi:hypothetical protein
MAFVTSSSAVHTDRVLQTLATEYTPRGLIARQLVTNVPTNGQQSGSFRTRNKRNMLQESNGEIGELGMPAEVTAGYSTSTYACENYAWLARVPINVASQADVPLNVRQDAIKVAKSRSMLAEERRWATIFTATANYASGNYTTLTGTDQWSDHTNSDPIDDVNTYLSTIYASPDARLVGWMGWDVWMKLKEHPAILERVKYGGTPGGAALASRQAVAQVFGLDDLLVGSVRSTVTNEAQTATYARIWGKYFGVAAVEPGQSPEFLGFAARFSYQEEQLTEDLEPLAGLNGVAVAKIASSVDEVVVANDAAFLLVNAVA